MPLEAGKGLCRETVKESNSPTEFVYFDIREITGSGAVFNALVVSFLSKQARCSQGNKNSAGIHFTDNFSREVQILWKYALLKFTL